MDELEKMSRKFWTPMNRAVSKPVWVDHAWNDSHTVSSMGTRTKTVISPVAGASIGNVDCVCLRRLTGTSDMGEGGAEAPTLGEDRLLRGARQNLSRIRLCSLLRIGRRELADLDGFEGLLQRLGELLTAEDDREALRIGERLGIALEERIAVQPVGEGGAV